MEKNLDHWKKIANLIEKDKGKALADFRSQEFDPITALEIHHAKRSLLLLAHHPVFLAIAASLLLVVGLVSFWLLRGNWHSVSTAPAPEQLLDGSFLYNIGSEPKTKAPEPRAVSSFFPSFSAWGEAAGLNRAAAPVAKPVDPSLTVEHGDPAAVQRKMKKVIQENTLERMLIQFCQICKEV